MSITANVGGRTGMTACSFVNGLCTCDWCKPQKWAELSVDYKRMVEMKQDDEIKLCIEIDKLKSELTAYEEMCEKLAEALNKQRDRYNCDIRDEALASYEKLKKEIE